MKEMCCEEQVALHLMRQSAYRRSGIPFQESGACPVVPDSSGLSFSTTQLAKRFYELIPHAGFERFDEILTGGL